MFVEQMRQLKIDQFALIALECALMTQLNASKYTSKIIFGIKSIWIYNENRKYSLDIWMVFGSTQTNFRNVKFKYPVG